MLKLNAAFSKKIPVPGEDFSSQSFHASIECECADALTAEQLQAKIHDTFALVKDAVESELHGKTAAGRCDLQPRVRKIRAEQQQTFGAGIDAAQYQPVAAIAARERDPADCIQRRGATADNESRCGRRFGDAVGAEGGANSELSLGFFCAQRETLAEGDRHFALAQR